MKFSNLLILRTELSEMALNTEIGENIIFRTEENSPINNIKRLRQRNINSHMDIGMGMGIGGIGGYGGGSFSYANNNNLILPKISKSFQLKKNLYNNLNNINKSGGNIIIGKNRKHQNSFSFLSNLSNINKNNNISLSLNHGINGSGRKKIPKIPNNYNYNSHRKSLKPLELDYSEINNSNTIPNNSKENTNSSFDNNLNSPKNINNLVSIAKYNSVKTETMAKYRIEIIKKEEEKDDDKLNGNLFGNQSSVESSKNSMEGKLCDYDIQINIKDKNFAGPEESKDVISTNKFIYDNLSGSLFDIQKIIYDKTIKDIEHYNDCKHKMKKIRVSSLVPKTTQEKIIVPKPTEQNNIIEEQVNEENANVNKEDGENGEGAEGGEAEEDDYMEKKKEKEKLKQKKLKQTREKEEIKVKRNSIIHRSIENDFYAEYRYSSKIFPEGREQFSLKYNLIDCVMFGGLVTNKNNNNVWRLDPCK
jgi:hypothetical protein